MYNPLGFEKVRDFSMAHRVNMISAENNQVVLKTFTGDSVIEFDKWTRRFNDIVRLQGNKWNENDKIAHLEFFLDGTPRRMLDTLSADETKTLKDVIENLRKKMDTPQRRELTYQALAACKQEGNEQVKVFLDRLIPLIDATAQNLTPEAKEEVQCRMLLEKLRPDISHERFARALAVVADGVALQTTSTAGQLDPAGERDVSLLADQILWLPFADGFAERPVKPLAGEARSINRLPFAH